MGAYTFLSMHEFLKCILWSNTVHFDDILNNLICNRRGGTTTTRLELGILQFKNQRSID